MDDAKKSAETGSDSKMWMASKVTFEPFDKEFNWSKMLFNDSFEVDLYRPDGFYIDKDSSGEKHYEYAKKLLLEPAMSTPKNCHRQ